MALIDALKLAAQVDELHEKYDGVMGGEETRPFRELVVYCAAKCCAAGADIADVVFFLLEVAQLSTTDDPEQPS